MSARTRWNGVAGVSYFLLIFAPRGSLIPHALWAGEHAHPWDAQLLGGVTGTEPR